MLFNWEREFRFCDDRLLEGGEACSGTEERITFYEAFTPLLSVFTDFDPAAGRTDAYLFGALAAALQTHYPTSANTMYQEGDSSAAFYARGDGGVLYEPILARILGGCAWNQDGTGRQCQTDLSAQLLPRLGALLREVDGVSVGAGDGLDVFAAMGVMALDSTRHAGLQNRMGSGYDGDESRHAYGRLLPGIPPAGRHLGRR